MCGFAAVVGAAQCDTVVTAMLAAIASRGPDERGYCCTDWFSLAVCRLAIWSLSEGRQPARSADMGVTVAFNGELYNHEPLARDVERRTGVRARSEVDLLLTGYLERGGAFVSELDGDFAVAVFDSRTRTCELWRDRFGVKPVYYAALPGGVMLVASEIRGLVAHPDLPVEWDEVALAERLVLSFWSEGRTPFRAVRQLRPGHRLLLGPYAPSADTPPGGAEVRWASAAAARPPGLAGDDRVAACARTVASAVARRVTHTEVDPVVVALSGGVDSSILAALASREGNVTAVTICGAAHEPDARYAAAVATALGLQHHLYEAGAHDLLAGLPALVLAQPAAGGTLAWLLGQTTKRLEPGAKVLLCGEGADELFRGYLVHRRTLPFRVHAAERLEQVPDRIAAQSALLARVPGWAAADEADVYEEIADVFATGQLVTRHLVPFDHGTMAHGLECRVPYLDTEVVGFLQTLPTDARAPGPVGKPLLRALLSRVFADHPVLARALLSRPPAAAPAATRAARSRMMEPIAGRLATAPLSASHLAPFARNLEELFWLGATHAVYVVHRGAIDGMSFDELLEDAARGPE